MIILIYLCLEYFKSLKPYDDMEALKHEKIAIKIILGCSITTMMVVISNSNIFQIILLILLGATFFIQIFYLLIKIVILYYKSTSEKVDEIWHKYFPKKHANIQKSDK